MASWAVVDLDEKKQMADSLQQWNQQKTKEALYALVTEARLTSVAGGKIDAMLERIQIEKAALDDDYTRGWFDALTFALKYWE